MKISIRVVAPAITMALASVIAAGGTLPGAVAGGNRVPTPVMAGSDAGAALAVDSVLQRRLEALIEVLRAMSASTSASCARTRAWRSPPTTRSRPRAW